MLKLKNAYPEQRDKSQISIWRRRLVVVVHRVRIDVRDDETEAEAGNETDGANNEEGQGEAADGVKKRTQSWSCDKARDQCDQKWGWKMPQMFPKSCPKVT